MSNWDAISAGFNGALNTYSKVTGMVNAKEDRDAKESNKKLNKKRLQQDALNSSKMKKLQLDNAQMTYDNNNKKLSAEKAREAVLQLKYNGDTSALKALGKDNPAYGFTNIDVQNNHDDFIANYKDHKDFNRLNQQYQERMGMMNSLENDPEWMANPNLKTMIITTDTEGNAHVTNPLDFEMRFNTKKFEDLEKAKRDIQTKQENYKTDIANSIERKKAQIDAGVVKDPNKATPGYVEKLKLKDNFAKDKKLNVVEAAKRLTANPTSIYDMSNEEMARLEVDIDASDVAKKAARETFDNRLIVTTQVTEAYDIMGEMGNEDLGILANMKSIFKSYGADEMTKADFQKAIMESKINPARAIKLKEMSGAAVAEFEFNIWEDIFSGNKWQSKEYRMTKLGEMKKLASTEFSNTLQSTLTTDPRYVSNNKKFKEYSNNLSFKAKAKVNNDIMKDMGL